MKRSEINTILRRADEFLHQQSFRLPPFAYWTPEQWRATGPEAREIAENKLGWDITDFGTSDFEHTGLFLFTIRNGQPENWKAMKGKLYAEKILICEDHQITPFHFHWSKMEDIINRGGGTLAIQLYNATPDEELDRMNEVIISIDSVRKVFPPGAIVHLQPGESISLPQYCYHQFWAEDGRTLVGEVSMVNDDNLDNRFYEPVGRFPTIDEDEAPLHLLCTDYPNYYQWL